LILTLLAIPKYTAGVSSEVQYSTHTYIENWSNTKFELKVTSPNTWILPDNYEVNISITITDMGGNQYIWINDIEISVYNVENRTLVDKYLYNEGESYSITLSLQMGTLFTYLKPGDKDTINLYISVEGEVKTKEGFEFIEYTSESYSFNVLAPQSPVKIDMSLPKEIILNDTFNIEVSVTNIGNYSISDLQIKLFEPSGASLLGSDIFTVEKLEPGSVYSVRFTLKAEVPGDTYADVTVSYYTINGYYVTHFDFPFCEKKVSFTIRKIPSSFIVSIEPESINLGEVITINIKLDPPGKQFVTLLFTRPDGSSFDKTILTNADGTYIYKYKPDMAGDWALKVSWDGTLEIEGAEKAVSFTVSKATSSSPGSEVGGALFLILIIVIVVGGIYYWRKRRG